MTTGKIQYAQECGTFILKLIGDVRLTLCTTLDKRLEVILNQPTIEAIIIDLSETDAIDSTSLGLLARLSIQAKKKLGIVPTILSPKDDINRILFGMGLDQIFTIVSEFTTPNCPVIFYDLPGDEDYSDQAMMEKVITAHKMLMAMNENNRQEFGELVHRLEQEQEQDRITTSPTP